MTFSALRLALLASLASTFAFDNLATAAQQGLACTQPPNAVKGWRFNRYDKTTNDCVKHPTENRYWTMLNAYRSGGENTQHWKYQTWEEDPECLLDWTYYGKDGNWVVEHVHGRLTRKGDKAHRLWCAMAVAQTTKNNEPTGVEGKQWAYCDCTMQS